MPWRAGRAFVRCSAVVLGDVDDHFLPLTEVVLGHGLGEGGDVARDALGLLGSRCLLVQHAGKRFLAADHPLLILNNLPEVNKKKILVKINITSTALIAFATYYFYTYAHINI